MKVLCFDHMTLDEHEEFMKDIGAEAVYATTDKHMRSPDHIEFALNGKRYQLAGFGLKLQRANEANES